METKVCKTCKIEKPLNAFYSTEIYKSGYDNTCKLCRSEQAIERRRIRNSKKKTKVCVSCKKEKSLQEFEIVNERYRNKCESCRKADKKKFDEKRALRKKEQKEITIENSRDKIDETIYKRMINQPRTKGLADRIFDYPLKLGKKYKVEKLGLREGQTKTNETFQGELTQITDNFFVLKNKVGFCECFLKNDYKLGEIKILEV